ncbi:MAG: homoserine kinase [Robiginitomaculum sp.]|nr:homoserine kinase [Robiginitomaculum sp.]
MTNLKTEAIAPASIANLAVGFDLLGQAFDGCHDRVTATRIVSGQVELGEVSGLMDTLPSLVPDNTALRGADALLSAMGQPFGVRLDIVKGIPKSAGLGGSAASSVAAVIAVNALLDKPLSTAELFVFALEGERASSNPPPADNVAACLFGGVVLLEPGGTGQVVPLPPPEGVMSVVFHPKLEIQTGESRKALSVSVPLAQTLDFASHIASFTAACYRNDIPLLRRVMHDVLIEPQRAPSIAPFAEVQQVALAAGAIACSISGSGPSIFAWVETERLQAVTTAMADAFHRAGIQARSYTSPLTVKPARLLPA